MVVEIDYGMDLHDKYRVVEEPVFATIQHPDTIQQGPN